MKKKRTSNDTPDAEAPYDPNDGKAVKAFWKDATLHRGIAQLRAKRGRPTKSPEDRKQQIALRIDADVLAWYRAQGGRWQTRMNAVLKAYRDATV